jgi:hypothetical protein
MKLTVFPGEQQSNFYWPIGDVGLEAQSLSEPPEGKEGS